MIKRRFRSDYYKIKLRRLSYFLKHDFLSVERIALMIAFIFCIAWTWGAISSMSRNWELEQRVEARQRELTLLKLEVENLELENRYFASEEYQELAARRQQNKKFPGETLVYLSKNSPAAKIKHAKKEAKPIFETPPNLKQWISFLFGA